MLQLYHQRVQKNLPRVVENENTEKAVTTNWLDDVLDPNSSSADLITIFIFVALFAAFFAVVFVLCIPRCDEKKKPISAKPEFRAQVITQIPVNNAEMPVIQETKESTNNRGTPDQYGYIKLGAMSKIN